MRFGRTTRYPGGALGEISKAIAAIQSSLEQLKAVYPIHLRAQGNSASIEFIGDYGGGGIPTPYESYFRVLIDASGDIAVTSGGLVASGICGTVKVNGIRANVDAATFSVGVSTTHYIWLHSWIDPDAEVYGEIIDGGENAPNNSNGGIGYASQLLARVTVDADGNASIVQDYLRGGEHMEIISGDCSGGVIEEIS